MIFDTLADHIFPPGAELQQKKQKKNKQKLVSAHVHAELSTLHTSLCVDSKTTPTAKEDLLLCEYKLYVGLP